MTARERQAAINELRDVWMGKTDLSKASAQVRLNWEVVRDCIDRFANRDNPNTSAQYRGPAHVNQDDDIDSEQTLEELLDELNEKFGELPETPTTVQVMDVDLLVHVPVHRGQKVIYIFMYSILPC